MGRLPQLNLGLPCGAKVLAWLTAFPRENHTWSLGTPIAPRSPRDISLLSNGRSRTRRPSDNKACRERVVGCSRRLSSKRAKQQSAYLTAANPAFSENGLLRPGIEQVHVVHVENDAQLLSHSCGAARIDACHKVLPVSNQVEISF